MLILNIGDSHISGLNPICRIDNLVETQWEKWKEIVEIANKNNCPIISTGDIFETSIISNSILTIFGQIIEKLKHNLYCVFGNHDLKYHSIDIFDRTSLGMLIANSSKIKHISEFYKDYDIEWDYCDWGEHITDNDSKYLLIHQAIINTKMGGGINSWILKDTEFARNIETDKELQRYELIICGHWHKKYKFKYKNTTIINPGPVTRTTVENLELPTVQLINLKTKDITEVKLESTKPTEDVISDLHLNLKSNKFKIDITDFVNALKTKHPLSKDKSGSPFLDSLMQILDSHKLEPKLENLIREMVAKIIEVKKKKEN